MADTGTQATGARLARGERREALLTAAAALVSEGSLERVSMESVAERAGVSRPLVYKHFSSRDELLGALYQREAAQLHEAIASEVGAARSLEEMFRRLVRASLRASVERGPLFAKLRTVGEWSREVGREQRKRDDDTARAFVRRAERELGLDTPRDAAAVRLLLGLIDQVLAQFRANRTAARAALLEEAYMAVVTATLTSLGEDR